MARYSELYSNSVNNAQIAASGIEIFGVTQTDKERTQKSGSYNTLLLSNNTTNQDIKISLDGLADKIFVVAAKTSLSIVPDEGIFFNSIHITSLDAVNVIVANALYIRYGIAQYLGP